MKSQVRLPLLTFNFTFFGGERSIMATMSLGRMLLGRLMGHQASRRGQRRPAPIAALSHTENLEPRLLMTADPDDQIRDAINLGTITTPVTRNGSVNVAIDVDIYRVDVTAGQRLSFDIDRPTTSRLDSYIRLFNSTGQQLALSDDAAAPGEVRGLDSYLEFTFATAGSYYLGVSGFGNRNYNAVTGLGDTNGRTGNYGLVVTNIPPSDADDQISEAINLGAISGTVTRTGLSIDGGTDVDMFRVTVTAGQTVRFDIDNSSQGFDSYIRLFNASGTELARNDDGPTPGESASMESYLQFTFATAGNYSLGVSGFRNSEYNAVSGAGDVAGSTGQYTLEVSPGTVDPPPPPGTGNRVLYLNFDGYNITRTELVRWAGSDWSGSVNDFDADQNGVNVQAFLGSRADREQIISQMLTMIQTDLNPFGIRVMRTTSGAVENQGATTLFLGRSTLSNGLVHVADDIDFGNNNRTDIAFVGDENWGTASNTAIAMSDVALHEAGHTFGLYHVQSGSAAESMGLRYNTPQSQWVTDTRFVDQAFNELPGHGGGRGPQNAFQTMLRAFPVNGSTPAGSNGANPLTAQEVRNILLAGYGEGPHNLPIQDGFAPDGAYDDHDHDHEHHVEGTELSEAIAVATRLDATRLSTEIGSYSDVLVATANQTERLTQIGSSQAGESSTQLNTHDDDDQVTLSNHAEFANQFHSAAWGSLMEGLQSLA